jgi:hypothetical protein
MDFGNGPWIPDHYQRITFDLDFLSINKSGGLVGSIDSEDILEA